MKKLEEYQAFIDSLARKALHGEGGLGSIEGRKNRLGYLYNDVQNKLNEIFGLRK